MIPSNIYFVGLFVLVWFVFLFFFILFWCVDFAFSEDYISI